MRRARDEHRDIHPVTVGTGEGNHASLLQYLAAIVTDAERIDVFMEAWVILVVGRGIFNRNNPPSRTPAIFLTGDEVDFG
jgi:hypothetical protein